MAKAPAGKEENGQATANQTAPMLNVLAQYIKDLSFENPNAPNSLRPSEQPNINFDIDVEVKGISPDNFEVSLNLGIKATTGQSVMFNTELAYAGIFRLQNIPAEALQPTLHIECARLLFPFARQIIADATRDGGFPPLMMDPVDFARLYQSKLAKGAKPESTN